MSKVLVIGASGVLGSGVCKALSQHGDFMVIKGSRVVDSDGSRRVDVTSHRSVRDSIKDMDAVVTAVSQNDPLVQRACADRGIPCVDVTPNGQLRDQMRTELANSPAPLVVMCGFYPGLSGVLGAHVAGELDEVHQLKIGLLQSTNANVGPTGVKDMLRAVSRPVPVEDGQLPGFSQKSRMSFGPRDSIVRRMDYDEAKPLSAHLGVTSVHYFTAWSSTIFTMNIAVLQRLRILALLLRSPLSIRPRHNPKHPETAWLTAEARGNSGGTPVTRYASVKAWSDYGATALVTSAVVEHVLAHRDNLTGVVTPFDFMDLDDFRTIFSHDELTLFM